MVSPWVQSAGPVRGSEITERAEDLTLAPLGKPRPDAERVVGGERQRPAGARIAFRDGQHHPPERGRVRGGSTTGGGRECRTGQSRGAARVRTLPPSVRRGTLMLVRRGEAEEEP